jgi:hypothetical protein
MDAGRLRCIVRAVFLFTLSSKRVGRSTGSSADFARLRVRSIYVAERRQLPVHLRRVLPLGDQRNQEQPSDEAQTAIHRVLRDG